MLNDSQLFVYYDNNGSFTDFSRAAESLDTTDLVSFDLSTVKKLYIGKANTFNHRYFSFKTPQPGAILSVKYYSDDASDYTAVEDLRDLTDNFSQSGHINFKLPVDSNDNADWALSTVNSKELYWIEISASSEITGFELYTIKNTFTTDDDVTKYFSRLSRYKPSTRTDFNYLHEIAKDEIINDLKQSGRIEYEDQLKDSLVYMQQVAVYKFLELLLLDHIEDESIEKQYNIFKAAYRKRIDNPVVSIDANKDEGISTSERNKISASEIVRI